MSQCAPTSALKGFERVLRLFLVRHARRSTLPRSLT